jgi:hypothetical protein
MLGAGAAMVMTIGLVQAARWNAVPGVRAGVLDGPGALADVFDIEVGPGGEILAAQVRGASIAVFAENGDYRRSIGRRGDGPGEFQILGRMGWSGDTLWVIDFGKLHLFTRELEFVRTIVHPSVPPPAGVQRLIPGPVLADGSVLAVPIFPDSGRLSPFLRISPTGVIQDTLFHLPQRNTIVHLEVGGVRPANLLHPWIANPLWLPASDGRSVVIVKRPIARDGGRGTFELMRLNLAGDTLVKRAIAYQPIEIDDESRDRAYARLAVRAAQQTEATPARAEREIRQVIEPARHHAPVSELVVGRDSTIWLRREDLGRETASWDIFDFGGSLLARLTLPSDFRVLRAQRSRVWGVETDSLDVQYIRVYDITMR